VDPPALTGQAVGPGGGFASKKPTAKSDLANRTMTDLIGITVCAWQRVPGAWSIGVGVGVTLAILARLAIGFYVAKSANSPLMFGNLGNSFAIAKIANDWRENRQREVWRGDLASLIGAKTLAILAKLSAFLSRRRLTYITPPLFFKKTMTILPIAEKASSNQTLTVPAHWQFSLFPLPSL
jgi:hypothetical protein